MWFNENHLSLSKTNSSETDLTKKASLEKRKESTNNATKS